MVCQPHIIHIKYIMNLVSSDKILHGFDLVFGIYNCQGGSNLLTFSITLIPASLYGECQKCVLFNLNTQVW